MLDDLRFRLRALFRRKMIEEELDEEFRFHFEHEVEKYKQVRHDSKRRPSDRRGSPSAARSR